jgi:hypothetical protein
MWRWIAAALLLQAAPAVAQEELYFRSPTGNIACAIFAGDWTAARCDLAEFNPSFPRPADCEFDWGYAFEVGIRGRAEPLCAGDTVRVPGARVLAYGLSVTLGGITCTSAETGMTCVNRDGHGFTVARARQRVF